MSASGIPNRIGEWVTIKNCAPSFANLHNKNLPVESFQNLQFRLEAFLILSFASPFNLNHEKHDL